MSQRMRLFILILIINLCTVLIYLIWNHIRRKEKLGSVWMKAVMMLLCPVIGPTFILLAFFFYKLFSFGGVDLSDVVFSIRTRMWKKIWFRWKRRWRFRTGKVSVP